MVSMQNISKRQKCRSWSVCGTNSGSRRRLLKMRRWAGCAPRAVVCPRPHVLSEAALPLHRVCPSVLYESLIPE